MSETHAREVTVTRYFAAPPDLVYRAFTDPEQLAQWFGPAMMVVPADSVDLDVRRGGHWRLTMVGKDNPAWQMPVELSLTEVVENSLLVGYELASGIPGLEDGTRMWMSVELVPEGEGTRLNLRQGPFPEDSIEMVTAGWTQAWEKLDAVCATLGT